jgi:DNA mismatch endonuclease (patch repair protein)
MSPKTQSAVKSGIRGKDTGPEKTVAAGLASVGLEWESHVQAFPGRPDFVFAAARVVIFVDGDFWHGWRFPQWRNKLSEKWEAKIELNCRHDARNRQTLRRMGWKVVRLWEHQIERDMSSCLKKVLSAFHSI